ncbi:MAG: acetate--CoA ligase [Candidatus Omnitrophica bacterium]|nr:acetate--CoA ligase [Candidatus Omnitrophota bacterium]
MVKKALEALLKEDRVFPPAESFRRRANVSDPSVYDSAAKDRLKFWADLAGQLHWFKKWDRVLEWDLPYAKWFVGGTTNISFNCLDRHLAGPRRDKTAILWEGEPGDERRLTYVELHREVCRFANGLKLLGVQKGDRVTLYMPMVPELCVAMLSCARIGAVHSVVFGGFSAEALRDRINDSKSKIVVTADGGWRRGAVLPLKQFVDEALTGTPSVERVVVFKRSGSAVPMKKGRDLGWEELVGNQSDSCEAEPLDSEQMLYLLYTSGTTGKPKGIIHTTGGYMVGCYASTHWIFDLKEEDVYWCSADIGWVTGHSYVVYGPLLNGATVLMYEGAPNHPDNGRFWAIVEKYRVSVFYTAPTAIRSFMKWGDDFPGRHDLSSLRLLGSVGEPINPEAWIWYHQTIGGGRCPIVDTWWQTETGHILISPLPGITATKPGSATRPFPGIEADVVNDQGESADSGYLVIKSPWPGMLRGIYGDPERYREIYWSRFPNLYFTGDGCKRDKDGFFWLLGRVDDVLKVSGHRLSTMEIESALVDHPAVAEAAVIGKSHEIKENAVVAFVTLKGRAKATPELNQQLKEHVVKKIGSIARPDEILFTADLPKTRSGKIMRRLLRDIAEGRALGDTSTLADAGVVNSLKEKYEED